MLTYMIEYRNMKKGLIAAGLLVSLSGTAQDVSTYTPGTMGEGVVYYLPKTEIELQRQVIMQDFDFPLLD